LLQGVLTEITLALSLSHQQTSSQPYRLNPVILRDKENTGISHDEETVSASHDGIILLMYFIITARVFNEYF